MSLAPDLERLSNDELLRNLEASANGLTREEAGKRLVEYGRNELTEHRTNPILKFLGYFWGPIPWMIEAAVILSAMVRHWADFSVILVLLVANAVVGFYEEYQADNAIAALKAKLALTARVLRDGAWITAPAAELVPGDLIRVRLGDIVPADVRLLGGEPVEVDQAALTGESLPVERKPGESLYSGSILRQGEAESIVFGTGENTYFGRTARLVQEVHTVSHFQRAVLKIGNYLIVLAVVLVAVIICVALVRGDPMLESRAGREPVLLFALVLTVASIPVAMPTVLSVTMAVGARLLAKREAIVSRLSSIEELAGVDVLFSDKTGTLTQNKLTLGEPYCVKGMSAADVILAASLASRGENNDVIDLAVIAGLPDRSALSAFKVQAFTPFDPVRKRTEATVAGQDGSTFRVSKGAAQVIIELAKCDSEGRKRAEEAVTDFAKHGYRSLGVAKTDPGGGWRLLGVLPLFDPPREDARSTIEAARDLGLELKMVTGDQLAIAQEIAEKVGLGTHILDASTFEGVKAHQAANLDAEIDAADGFAQVFPEHKFRLVGAMQDLGHIVGMTGDGVNDAPALKKADCGIAVSGATDAARAAAAIVLLTPGLSVIVDAVRESRRIFQRMMSYATYRIAETIRVVLFMTLSILAFNFYPVTAMMIVLLALLNDGAILSIAYDNVHESDRPEAWNMRIVLGVASVLGVAGVLASFGLFYLGERVFNLSRDTIQSLMYLKLSVAGHLTIFVTRTRGPFWSHRPAKVLLLAVVVTQIAATLIAVYGLFMSPIGWKWALVVWVYALAWFLLSDVVKLAAYRAFDRAPASERSIA